MRELKIAGVAVTRDKTDQNNPRWLQSLHPIRSSWPLALKNIHTFHMYLVGLHIFMGHYYKYIGWVAK